MGWGDTLTGPPDHESTVPPADICREVYEETRRFHEEKVTLLGSHDHGFRVLYGPPVVNSPLCFVGYQPGGTLSHSKPEEHEGWPSESAYATGDPRQSPFWRQVQYVWDAPLLARSTGLNAIFFRSPDIARWRSINRALRLEIETFCTVRDERIVRALAPQRVVVIGTGTFDLLTSKGGTNALTSRGRVLIKQGELWGSPAFSVIHLSGARISTADRDLIREFFLNT